MKPCDLLILFEVRILTYCSQQNQFKRKDEYILKAYCSVAELILYST